MEVTPWRFESSSRHRIGEGIHNMVIVKTTDLMETVRVLESIFDAVVQTHAEHFVEMMLLGEKVVFMFAQQLTNNYAVIEIEKLQYMDMSARLSKKKLAKNESMYHYNECNVLRTKYQHKDLFCVEFVCNEMVQLKVPS